MHVRLVIGFFLAVLACTNSLGPDRVWDEPEDNEGLVGDLPPEALPERRKRAADDVVVGPSRRAPPVEGRPPAAEPPEDDDEPVANEKVYKLGEGSNVYMIQQVENRRRLNYRNQGNLKAKSTRIGNNYGGDDYDDEVEVEPSHGHHAPPPRPHHRGGHGPVIVESPRRGHMRYEEDDEDEVEESRGGFGRRRRYRPRGGGYRKRVRLGHDVDVDEGEDYGEDMGRRRSYHRRRKTYRPSRPSGRGRHSGRQSDDEPEEEEDEDDMKMPVDMRDNNAEGEDGKMAGKMGYLKKLIMM